MRSFKVSFSCGIVINIQKHVDFSVSSASSYEDLEMIAVKPTEETPLDSTSPDEHRRRISMKKLVKQQSIMETQKTADGTMNMTYWF